MPTLSFSPILRPWVLVVACLLTISCASMRPVAPEVNLLGIRVGELTLSHANLLADLRLYNANPVPLTIEAVDYAFFLNGIRVADGRTLAPVRIGAGEYGETVLRLSAGYLNLLQLTSKLKPDENLRYSLEGSVKVGGFRILDRTFPFKREGIIDPRLLPVQ